MDGLGDVPDDVQVTEVDGVTTVWCRAPGQLRAGLVLRMGWADETLPTRGIGHMLEHLALFGIRRPGDHMNGSVDASIAQFGVHGEPGEVVDFLDRVTHQLVDPPVARLADEVGVLASEMSGKRPGFVDRLLALRYGAGTYGLGVHDEIGVRGVTPQALSAWAARFAVRDNAVLWLSGPPPAGLRLHLPSGPRQDPPDATASLLAGAPAWATGPKDGVGALAVVPRGWATVALSRVVHTLLVEELRVTMAVAYSPQAGYRAVTGTHGWLMAGTDLVGGRQSEAARPFLSMLARIGGEADHPIGDEALEDALETYRREQLTADADPQAVLGRATADVWDVLMGAPLGRSSADRLAVTPQQVRDRAREAVTELVAEVPPGLGPRRHGWVELPFSGYGRLEGGTETRELAEDPRTLSYGAAGLMISRGDHHLSVPLGSTAAVQRWRDGRRVLVSVEGNQIDLEPTLWADGRAAVEWVDRTWPARLLVDMPDRGMSDVPQPRPPVTAPAVTPPAPSILERPVLLTLLVLAFSLTVVLLIVNAVGGTNPGPFVAAPVGFAVAAYRFARDRRRGGGH